MADIRTTQPEAIEILSRLDALDLKQRDLAAALDLSENKLSKVRAGERQMKAGEVLRAREWLDNAESREGYVEQPDLPDHPADRAYVIIEALPTFVGAGGGGTREADREKVLVPRSLIVDELRGKPEDFLLIDIRGDSMEPDFRHGDQLLVDRHDLSPAQPGPFALWDGEWGEYVVKNVERAEGVNRIFPVIRNISRRISRPSTPELSEGRCGSGGAFSAYVWRSPHDLDWPRNSSRGDPAALVC